MTVGLLEELNERIKALGGDWTRYTVVGSFLLYVLGYLTLRFHVTTLGIGTDLAVLDERYLFTGARFVIYLLAAVPSVILGALPLVAVGWLVSRLLFDGAREGIRAWISQPTRLALFGIVFSVLAIQLFMRQCFSFSDLLLAHALPDEPRWLVALLLDDGLMTLYFTLLVATCAVPLAILWTMRGLASSGVGASFAQALLAFLVAVQLLFLPVNYGVLIADKSLPRVAALGSRPLAAGEEAWLAWEGKDGVTFLVRSADRGHRTLLTLPKSEVKQMEIVGFDKILPTLFGRRPESRR